MKNLRKRDWTARLYFVSTRTIPGPRVVTLHLKLDREPDRSVLLELDLADRRQIKQAIERLETEDPFTTGTAAEPVTGVDPRD